MKNRRRKRIREEIEEFLEYLAKEDEDARKEDILKKKFGEKKYKAIYDIIGGKYTGGFPKKEGKKRDFILCINDNGLKFLEELQKERIKQWTNWILAGATVGLMIVTCFYVVLLYQSNKILSSQFETENRPWIIIDGEIRRGNDGNEMIIILPLKNVGKTPANINKITIYTGVSWYNLEEKVYNSPEGISWKIFPQETKIIMLPPYAFSKETIESQLIILRVKMEYSGEGVFSEEVLDSDTGNMAIGNPEPTQNI